MFSTVGIPAILLLHLLHEMRRDVGLQLYFYKVMSFLFLYVMYGFGIHYLSDNCEE